MYQFTTEFAAELDKNDALADKRLLFHIPIHNNYPSAYFTGNSLGAMPKAVRNAFELEFDSWEKNGVEGHFMGTNPWMHYHKLFREKAARIVGALPGEVVMMNTLTTNLNLLLLSFYKPTSSRYKIIMEAGAFPSDQYALESQARFHGFNPNDAIIEISPRAGENTLRKEDILDTIAKTGESLALVLFGGVNYYTGQFYPLEEITKAGHAVGAKVGFDLAHTAGNVPLKLHVWNVDFAVWCTYKYLNSGPGSVSGAFVHNKFDNDNTIQRLAGWWGHDEQSRFKMEKGFIPMKGAESWQMSNAPVMNMVAHKVALDIFDEVGMEKLREKSLKLTAFLEFIVLYLNEKFDAGISILTPSNPDERGCQLSLVFSKNGKVIHQKLMEDGIITDWREPDVIRVAPVPLYNTFTDILRFGKTIEKIITT